MFAGAPLVNRQGRQLLGARSHLTLTSVIRNYYIILYFILRFCQVCLVPVRLHLFFGPKPKTLTSTFWNSTTLCYKWNKCPQADAEVPKLTRLHFLKDKQTQAHKKTKSRKLTGRHSENGWKKTFWCRTLKDLALNSHSVCDGRGECCLLCLCLAVSLAPSTWRLVLGGMEALVALADWPAPAGRA